MPSLREGHHTASKHGMAWRLKRAITTETTREQSQCTTTRRTATCTPHSTQYPCKACPIDARFRKNAFGSHWTRADSLPASTRHPKMPEPPQPPTALRRPPGGSRPEILELVSLLRTVGGTRRPNDHTKQGRSLACSCSASLLTLRPMRAPAHQTKLSAVERA